MTMKMYVKLNQRKFPPVLIAKQNNKHGYLNFFTILLIVTTLTEYNGPISLTSSKIPLLLLTY